MAIDDPQSSELIDDQSFETAFGEPIERTLDLGTWAPDADLAAFYRHLEQEIRLAVARENEVRRTLRSEILARLRTRPNAPRGAGCYRATVGDLERVHKALLFNGATEACDGTSTSYDTLPATITQIGVCLVSYQGDQSSLLHRLYRRDLRDEGDDPLQDALALLENRRDGLSGDMRQRISRLARNGIMAYAERALLTYESTAIWRVGHGNPVAAELLTGSGSMSLLEKSSRVLSELVLGHRKFLFVPSAPTDRFLLTIGYALYPLEFAIVDTAEDAMHRVIAGGHYSMYARHLAADLCRDIGSKLVRGVYRASPAAPPYVFYSHVDHAQEAALLAMADSVLQEHRGFPMLIDLADRMCRSTFGNDVFKAAVETAYIHAGAPFRFLPEREGRT